MGLLDFNLEEVPELECVPEGRYKLQIVRAETKLDSHGNPGMSLSFSIEGKPNTKRVSSWLALPGENDDADTANSKLRRIKNFVLSFGVSPSNDSDEGYIGLIGSAVLSVSETPEYGEQNVIRRFVT